MDTKTTNLNEQNSSTKKIKIIKKKDPSIKSESFSLNTPWNNKRKAKITSFKNVQFIDIEEVNNKDMNELMGIAKELDLNLEEEVTKQRLVFKILEKAVHQYKTQVIGGGVFEKMQDGYGFLRSAECNYVPGPEDIYISSIQIRNFGLRTGDIVKGYLRTPKSNEKYFAIQKVNEINFKPVETITNFKNRVSFDSLTPYYATRKFTLEMTSGNYSTRIIDLFAPIGKGQRAMIVSPPKAGKTILLQTIANSIRYNHPEVFVIVLLIDERPEEVTDMKRNVDAEVISSTFDEPASRHVNVARIVLEKAKRLVEQKYDVVILLDSLTRLARAYNQVEPASGKILSGGVDSNALHRPKRFFGAARNIEEGGSLSIIATALVDTGSKMDEVIFEEFKGTGNMELVLNRKIAERRIFPSVDLKKSGTRREDLLLDKDVISKLFALRNALGDLEEVEVIKLVMEKMQMTKSNTGFLQAMNSGS